MKKETYCIRRKSSVGKQTEEIYNFQTQKWGRELSYGEPSFQATPEEAHELLEKLKEGYRGKWVRLYVS